MACVHVCVFTRQEKAMLRYFMTIYVWRVTDTLVTQTKTVTINWCCHPPTCHPSAEQSNYFPFSHETFNNRTCIRVSRRSLLSPNSHKHLWLLSSHKERNSISFTLPFLSLLFFTINNVCLLGQSSNRSPKKLRWFFFVVQYFGIVHHSTPYLHWWEAKPLTRWRKIASQKEFRDWQINIFSPFKTNVRKCHDFECPIHGIINSGKIEGAFHFSTK